MASSHCSVIQPRMENINDVVRDNFLSVGRGGHANARAGQAGQLF